MTDIAIIGMAARLPGASNVAAFWSNLCAGIETIRDVSEDELLRSGVHPSIWNRENYVRKAAFPENVEYFDAHFFGFTPNEATIIDPQHRLLLECAYEALEDAGQDPDRYRGPVGVFAGCALNTYLLTHLMSVPGLLQKIDLVQLSLASSADFLATRISYKLGLKGISHTVQCACSTSLVAIHLACQSLLTGESDMAMAGGVALNFYLRYGYSHVPGGMFSATGKCRAFDCEADGTVFGNGAGMVVLKRYEDAQRNRDQIYAIVKGSAVNNDGATKVGYTAPSVEGQSLAIAEALSNAGVSTSDIGYIETHGTGTPLGDPIEIEALKRAYRINPENGHRCLIGSVKTNIGHLDCAAGVSGFIKTVQILKHGVIPPSLHFVTPNPHIDFEETPFEVNTVPTTWPASNRRRVASLSAFGVGGTNAHMILEAEDYERPAERDEGIQIFIYSAFSETALDQTVAQTNSYLVAQPEIALQDASFTLATGRRQLPWRHSEILARNSSETKILATHRLPANVPAIPPSIVFLFPGQGSQTLTMGQEIYKAESVFRQTFDACLDLLSQFMNRDPRLLALGSTFSDAEALLRETEYAQPLLFAFEYALAQLWMSWGLVPDLMIGHSLGEYVAATIAETLRLEDALRLVAVRGQLMQTAEPGAMLGVPLSDAEAMSFTNETISLAAINSASQCVLSGTKAAIDDLHRRLEADGIHGRRLDVSRAFHSALMGPVLEKFRECLETVTLRPPKLPWMSNLTGTKITAHEAVDSTYWVNHLRHTVRFYENMREAHAHPGTIFLEVGPQRILQQLASRLPLSAKNQIALSSTSSEKSEYLSLLSTLGALWVRGAPIEWDSVYDGKDIRRISLPTYPFERQRCWVERAEPSRSETTSLDSPLPTTDLVDQDRPIPIRPHSRPQLSTPYIPPATPTQIRLVSMLEPIFGITPLGIRDNFFALGADSLLAINVVSQLKIRFGVDITAGHLYEALNIESLAALLEELMEDDTNPAVASYGD